MENFDKITSWLMRSCVFAIIVEARFLLLFSLHRTKSKLDILTMILSNEAVFKAPIVFIIANVQEEAFVLEDRLVVASAMNP